VGGGGDAGERPGSVAQRFRIGRASVYLWLKQRREEGRGCPKKMGGGPSPVIRNAVEAVLKRLRQSHLSAWSLLLRIPLRALRFSRPGAPACVAPVQAGCRAGDGQPLRSLPKGGAKAKTVRKLLDHSAFSYRYLPSYSPDLNPIELAWACPQGEA
jgi:hypothetical protein